MNSVFCFELKTKCKFTIIRGSTITANVGFKHFIFTGRS